MCDGIGSHGGTFSSGHISAQNPCKKNQRMMRENWLKDCWFKKKRRRKRSREKEHLSREEAQERAAAWQEAEGACGAWGAALHSGGRRHPRIPGKRGREHPW